MSASKSPTSVTESGGNSHPTNSTADKVPSPRRFPSESSSNDDYGIEIVSADHTKVGLPKAERERKKTQNAAEFKGSCFKSKTKIKIKIPLPWKSFCMSTKMLCALTGILGVLLVVTACAGVGVYFLTNGKKESLNTLSWGHHGRTQEKKKEIQIEVPNMKQRCDTLTNTSSESKRCVYSKIHYHKNCYPVKCFQMKYLFVGMQYGNDTVANIEINEQHIGTVYPSAHTYCGQGKWCKAPDSLTQTFECRKHYQDDPNSLPKEFSSATWVDSCGEKNTCMSVAQDSLSRSVFQTIQSYFACPHERPSECEEGLVETVPQIYFVTCDYDQTSGHCEGWPMQVRKCFMCPKYEHDKFYKIISKEYQKNDSTILDFTAAECKWSVWKNNTIIKLGLKPDGSRCMSVSTQEEGLCILGSCFVLGVNSSITKC